MITVLLVVCLIVDTMYSLHGVLMGIISLTYCGLLHLDNWFLVIMLWYVYKVSLRHLARTICFTMTYIYINFILRFIFMLRNS